MYLLRQERDKYVRNYTPKETRWKIRKDKEGDIGTHHFERLQIHRKDDAAWKANHRRGCSSQSAKTTNSKEKGFLDSRTSSPATTSSPPNPRLRSWTRLLNIRGAETLHWDLEQGYCTSEHLKPYIEILNEVTVHPRTWHTRLRSWNEVTMHPRTRRPNLTWDPSQSRIFPSVVWVFDFCQ
jgi:hypothetical protein